MTCLNLTPEILNALRAAKKAKRETADILERIESGTFDLDYYLEDFPLSKQLELISQAGPAGQLEHAEELDYAEQLEYAGMCARDLAETLVSVAKEIPRMSRNLETIANVLGGYADEKDLDEIQKLGEGKM